MCEIPGRTQPREGNIPVEEAGGKEEEGTEEERKKVEEEVRENEREGNF